MDNQLSHEQLERELADAKGLVEAINNGQITPDEATARSSILHFSNWPD